MGVGEEKNRVNQTGAYFPSVLGLVSGCLITFPDTLNDVISGGVAVNNEGE